MWSKSKLFAACVTAATMLSLAVTSASANRLSTDELGIETIGNPLRFETAGIEIACQFTYLGSFHERTFTKEEYLIGFVYHIQVAHESCEGGEVTVLEETLPWHYTFQGFIGNLPNITGLIILLVGLSISIAPEALGTACLLTTTVEHPLTAILSISGETVTELTYEEGSEIPLTGGFLCSFEQGHIAGTAEITNLPQTGPLHLRLI
jgi:hypothetical protein